MNEVSKAFLEEYRSCKNVSEEDYIEIKEMFEAYIRGEGEEIPSWCRRIFEEVVRGGGEWKQLM